MDAYMRITGNMKPMPGYDKATLPGVLEAQHEKEWSISGIPVSPDHKAVLSGAAEEFGLKLPF
jgi:LDH2 family malate/lactate/ureidoglycolate dehydrogenase